MKTWDYITPDKENQFTYEELCEHVLSCEFIVTNYSSMYQTSNIISVSKHGYGRGPAIHFVDKSFTHGYNITGFYKLLNS